MYMNQQVVLAESLASLGRYILLARTDLLSLVKCLDHGATVLDSVCTRAWLC